MAKSKLEFLGGIFSAGWGDKVLSGIVIRKLKKVDADRCYEYIRDNKNLVSDISDEEWRKYRRMARAAHINELSVEEAMKELRSQRLDLLGVIINHPNNGLAWLSRQIASINQKLTS